MRYNKDDDEVLDYLKNHVPLNERQEIILAASNAPYGSKLRQEAEEMIYFYTPPTPEEFLNPDLKFLDPYTIEHLYPHIREDFIEFNSNLSLYEDGAVLYGGTRTGKSVKSHLTSVYTMLKISYMRSPHMYFGVLPTSLISIYAVSFKDDKIHELIVDPIEKILANSPRFKKEKRKDAVATKGVTLDGVIHYSSASEFAAFTFPEFNLVAGRDPSEFVGANIVAATVSELTFYRDYGHVTDDEVLSLYSKLKKRINQTIGKGHDVGGWIILDGSARDADSPLEKLILNELANSPTVFYRRYATPDIPYLAKKLYPKYASDPNNPKNYFEVITGNADYPAQIIDKDPTKRVLQIKDVPEKLIKKVPIDVYTDAIADLIGVIRDTLGCPTSKESRFIQKANMINDIFDNPYLTNIIAGIQADAAIADPLHLFKKLTDFFIILKETSFYFKRARTEPRYIGVDLAKAVKGDVAGLCVLHKERSRLMQKVINVVDFAFAITPGTTGINLKSIQDLILQITKYSNVVIKGGAVDTFASDDMMQELKIRQNLPFENHSTVKDLQCWLNLSTVLSNQTLKAGKNIYIKNNLKALIRTQSKTGKEKIDHDSGTKNDVYNGDWENSECGINANDVIDAINQAVFVAEKDPYQPTIYYEDENLLASKLQKVDDIKLDFTREDIIQMAKMLGKNLKV